LAAFGNVGISREHHMDFFAEIIGAIIEFFADIWLDHVVERFRRWKKKRKEKGSGESLGKEETQEGIGSDDSAREKET
jgi:hypothetical protein